MPMAEKVYTSLKENNFAFINFNRGIGATLFIEGNMLGKASGSFTQFGHYFRGSGGDPYVSAEIMAVLEALISEHNIGRRAAAFGGKAPFSLRRTGSPSRIWAVPLSTGIPRP